MYNKVILVGRLTRDVELKYLSSGSSVANFGLATSRSWKDQNTGDKKEEVMFIDITVFGKGGEIANQYLKKGNRVLVEGRLSLDRWEDSQGNKRSKHKIIAENVQFMETKAESMASSASESNAPSYNNSQATDSTMKQTSSKSQEIDIEDDDIPF